VYAQVLNACAWVSRVGESIGVREGFESARAVEGGGVEGKCNSTECQQLSVKVEKPHTLITQVWACVRNSPPTHI
jgi:hypothetical protein